MPEIDRHLAYEAAVQGVAAPLGVLEEKFRCALHRPLRALREDFCGTAALLHRFVADADADGDDGPRVGLGVDLDPEVIQWARNHRDFPETTQLICGNVLDAPRTFLGTRPDAVSPLEF